MIQYTVYDTATGAVLRTGTAMTEASARLQGSKPGTSVTIVGSDADTEIINPGTGVAVPKTAMKVGSTLTAVNKTTLTANGTDMIRITSIPGGASYMITIPPDLGLVQPPDGAVTDGVLELTTTVPGAYSVILRFQNFLDFVVNFNAS